MHTNTHTAILKHCTVGVDNANSSALKYCTTEAPAATQRISLSRSLALSPSLTHANKQQHLYDRSTSPAGAPEANLSLYHTRTHTHTHTRVHSNISSIEALHCRCTSSQSIALSHTHTHTHTRVHNNMSSIEALHCGCTSSQSISITHAHTCTQQHQQHCSLTLRVHQPPPREFLLRPSH